jgi:DNA-binding MarR family transcriptional regulator
MKGLFNKVKNLPTRRRYVISTIRKGETAFETAIFEANFFYLPKSWSKPVLVVPAQTKDEAWDTHYLLAARLTKEYPIQVFQEYS